MATNKSKPPQFNVGDSVVLKSGGPVMTVSDPEDYHGQVNTQWFSGKKLERGSFPPEALNPAPPDAD